MSIFAQLETTCANAVERAFAIAFPSALQPVQIARKLVSTFESGAVPAARSGRRFIVRMSAADFARLSRDLPYLERQWAAMLRGLAERSGKPQRSPEIRAEAGVGIASGTVAVLVETLPEPLDLALRVRRGLPNGAEIALGTSAIVVGRDPSCDFVLVDPRVSRRHLEIVRDGAVFRFRDLESSNGTRVNGLPAPYGDLGLGDAVALGDSELVIVPGNGAA